MQNTKQIHIRNILTMLVIIPVLFTACKPDDEVVGSSACDILSFRVGNDEWDISGMNITFEYPATTLVGSLTPVITVSENASVSPESGVVQQDFFTASGVTYTVTAEDGSRKTYTAKATRERITLEDINVRQVGGTISVETLRSLAARTGYMPPAVLAFMQHEVGMYAVDYNTTLKGDPVRASGLLFLPPNPLTSRPLIIYNHGTIRRGEEPSECTQAKMTKEAAVIGAVASIFNCAVLMPDYVGYGVSKQINHPYVHAESLGQNSFDFIRTFTEYSDKVLGRPLSRDIVNVGYSEGGYAAVALHRAVQESNSEFHILKTYAGAGPYDHIGVSRELANKTEDLDGEYLSSYLWVLSVYKEYMGYTKPYDEIFSVADNEIFRSKDYDFGYLAAYQNHRNPVQLFRPDFLEGIRQSTDTELLDIAGSNSLIDFMPADSLILFHSESDQWVFPSNTRSAYESMKSRNSNAPVRMQMLPASEGKGHSQAAPIFLESTFLNVILTKVISE